MTTEQPERERMTDKQIDCSLCGGTEEVEITPHESEETLGRSGTYGCPKCIERRLRTDLAAMTERAERANQATVEAVAHGLNKIAGAKEVITKLTQTLINTEKERDTLRTQLTLAEQQRDAAVEGLEWISKQSNSAEVTFLKYEIGKILARIRELGEMEGSHD